MWLPETAVDRNRSICWRKHGILFAILAPHQAKSIRPLSGGEWKDVSGQRIDPARAYLFQKLQRAQYQHLLLRWADLAGRSI